MLRPRIIPSLLLSNGGLVKTTGFGNPKYVGDPINAVRIFNEKEADELVFLDIDATVKGEAPNLRLISQIAGECRMPLCYGGGVKSVETAKSIIELGVEKVAISSAAVERPELISEIAAAVGTQSVVVVLDAVRSASGVYEIVTHNAKRRTSLPLLDFAIRAGDLGAGEIVINSVERDGVMKGYDLDLARLARRALGMQITLLGGAGSLSHIEELIGACGVVGAAAGSLFVFKGSYRAVLINYPSRAQKEALLGAAGAV